ncbi:MAG: winged helix-turn-helix transcriptional regulator [Clostridiales bacterium]|nr:winged helix-turn-helix transcriptional regulator [Clostridiales bacterium]
MPTATRRVIVTQAPNFLTESADLMASFYDFKLRSEAQDAPWHLQPLLSSQMGKSLNQDKVAAAFPDMAAFLSLCREQAAQLLDPEEELAALFALRSGGTDEEGGYSFMSAVLHSLPVTQARDMQPEHLIRASLTYLHTLSGDLEIRDTEPAEAMEALLITDFEMSQVFDAVNRVPVPDSQRMLLLRYFQQIDAWFQRLKTLLIATEQILQQAFPHIRKRFEDKVRQLTREGQAAQPFFWLERMGSDASKLRPEEPFYLQVRLIVFNYIGFVFSHDRQLPLLVSHGLLFEELSAMQDARQARDKLTEQQLKAIADPTRLAIIRLLHEGEQYVQQLADALELTPATLSHHISQLLQALLLSLRVEGRRSYYSLNRAELAALSEDLGRLAGHQEENA